MVNLFKSLFGMSLTLQMAVATALGILLGVLLGDICSVFTPWGSAYILILKITTIPYLICAIIHGVGRLVSSSAKQILQKGLIFIGCAWAINILMIYITVFMFPRSHGIPQGSYSGKTAEGINFAQLLIPENIFYALTNNIVPAIVVFGILIGIALMHLKEKAIFMDLLETLVNALTRITGWISRITPIGTFLIIASQVGSMKLVIVQQVGAYLALYIATTLLIVFWVFPQFVSMLTTVPAKRWVKDLVPILVLAYTTNVVLVTLPFIIELIKRETEQFYQKDGRIKDQIQGIVSIIFNLPLGSLFIAIFIFFIALFYHSPLHLASQIQLFMTTFLTSLGAVGLGSWINSLTFLLDSLNLPLDAIDLYLSTLPFTAGFQSMVSAMEIASLSFLVALACHSLLKFRWHQILRKSVLTIGPVIFFAFVIKILHPFPPISNPHKNISEIPLTPEIAVRIYKPSDNLPSSRSGEVFERILRSKVLRVGYNINALPFCFENDFSELSGYDVSFAFALARDLGCSLEMVPMYFGDIAQDLENGLYDIAMSGLTINEERLRKMSFTNPYLDARIVFVMRKKHRKELTSIEAILERPSVQVAVLRGSSYETLAHTLFPDSQIVTIDNYDDYARYHPNAVLIRGEPQAVAWSNHYPNFTVVVPTEPLGKDSLGYAIKQNDVAFVSFMNQWLRLKKHEEFTQRQYDLWVLGKTETVLVEEPRWSVVRDVFHWVD
ncbi:MAG: cation:dicarboxylase symporter family transporter [Verrucomicrobia bacterium]|nr:cation:dicarboxylase symporter family transporter [Verrucomicrobiota bacterium]